MCNYYYYTIYSNLCQVYIPTNTHKIRIFYVLSEKLIKQILVHDGGSMKRICSTNLTRILRRIYRTVLVTGREPSTDNLIFAKEISQNTHLIRSCCLNILSIKRELSDCPVSEDKYPIVFEEAQEFSSILNYALTHDSIQDFLKRVALRRELTYAEISCLIPMLELSCLLFLETEIEKNGKSIPKVLHSLHLLNAYDCSTLAESLSRTEDVLKRDTTYPFLDAASKDLYRLKIRSFAKRRKQSERETAVDFLKEARKSSDEEKSQIGYYLLSERRNGFYFPVLCLIILFLLPFLYYFSGNFYLLLLSLIPLAISSKLLCDTLFSRFVKPKLLPKIKITKENCPKTLVCIVSMISDISDGKKFLHRLDVLAHRIPNQSISIGLLLDFHPSNELLSEDDRSLIEFMEVEISKRNRENNRFFCAIRNRQWDAEKFQYEAYGRKQGAMMDFCDLVQGENNGFSLSVGAISNAKYLITLDADTEPTPGAVEGLIGFMEHPNHIPRLTEDANGNYRVVRGYGAAAPRVEANPENSFRSPFSAMLSGNAGTEFYKNPHFNLYQDLFSEGIFCGKGIVHISLYKKIISDRFRQDPLLSHDLVEGELLRCANVTDLVFFDEIPETVLSDEKRTHRWIRGDFQNGYFLFSKQSRSFLFHFKIVHNLLRAVFPFFCFLSITSSILFGLNGLVLGLFWIVFPLLLRVPFLISILCGRVRRFKPLREFYDAIKESFVNIVLLPTRAINGIDAAIRGVIRQIRGKNKLEWTTAASSSVSSTEISDYYYHLKWQLLGFVFLFFPTTTLIGCLWLIGPVIARQISLPYPKDRVNTEELQADLSSMWQYFVDFMNEKNHWLPPDNYQQEPLNILATRTSPTNIGLGLLSVLGAYDLELISEEELYFRLEHSLQTIDEMPKWKGFLYNWYDTETLKVLSPKFVSTVDCGNYAASLFTLKNGLKKLDHERAEKIVNHISNLLADTDFSVLYDANKKLFPIGFNVEDGQVSSSYYDLYASETRLTSFYSIMMHQIPLEHWVRLSRPTSNNHGDLIVSSWSGTMFEYFMPHIFLPACRRTLSGEMLRGIISAQMRYRDKKIPWGISESSYYHFDALLNYQYRAFGIPAAALRRDLSFPQIISPYSTFLAYPWFPTLAEKNKKLLPKGKYGYFEAVDYRSGADNPRIVQSYMAHHIGMSFLSGVNILKERVMQKRFMEGAGEAYVSLLTEGIPVYSQNYFVDQGQDRERWEPTEVCIDKPDPDHPRVKLLSNGNITEILTDSGAGVLNIKECDITKYSSNPQSPSGVFLFIKNKGKLYGTTYAPLYQDKNYRMYFDGTGASCYGGFSDFETRLTVTMSPDNPVSVRELTIKNNLMIENSFEFFLSVEPVLCHRRAYEAHPEYKDLFLTAEYDPSLRTVSFCRKGETELWFSVTASESFQFDVCRDHFIDYEEIDTCKMEGCTPHPIFPALTLRGVLNIRGRGTGTVRFYLSAGKTKQESLNGLRSCVSQNFEMLRRRYEQFFDSFCISSKIRSADRMIFEQVASRVFFPHVKSATEKKVCNTLPLRTLWKFGISGDNPIFAIRIGEEISRILSFVKTMFLINFAGISADLVILYQEDEGYQTPKRTSIDTILSEVGASVRAHIFPLNIRAIDEYLLIQKCSRLFINLDRGWKLRNSSKTFRPIRKEGKPVFDEKIRIPLGRGGYTKNMSYIIPKTEKELLRPWGIVLANHRFGTILNERNLGYTFAENASENRITPRIPGNGTRSSAEELYAVIRGKRYDILRNAAVEFFPDRATYQIEIFGNKILTEVFVPKNFPAKIISVTVASDHSAPSEIVYEPHVILGKEDKGTVARYSEDGKIYFNNAANDFYGRGMAVLFGINVSAEGERLHFRPTDELKSATFVLAYGAGQESAKAVAGILSEPKRLKDEWNKPGIGATQYLKIETPDNELNAFCNGFLVQQILSSRIFGRTGPSQPGGAFGFRDQLQDALCIANFNPAYLKRQILRCCAHQFEEGDVLHWWHPRRDREDDGIKTRFSDDPFWLVYACCEYFKITENHEFFQRKVAYLKGSPLNESESDRYFIPEKSDQRQTIYQHVIKAIRYGMKTGQHGLILFGSGDWNDGMNGVEKGGETVWGTMFALQCLENIRPLVKILGTKAETDEINSYAEILRVGLEKQAFVGDRFLRGFRNNGDPFGGDKSIDLIPQAFSVFSKLDKKKTDIALDSAYRRLWDPERKLIKLLSPPYRPEKDRFPGTIADYPPGVRENGGQYTHGGIWFARALLQSGKIDKGWEILSTINPITHCRTPSEVRNYGAEPYVIAADVYALPRREGFAGWSHYTGSAGWYLKTVTEDLLGIQRQGRRVSISPNLPQSWNGYYAELMMEQDLLKIRVERGTDLGIFENGIKSKFVLLDGTTHEISVII